MITIIKDYIKSAIIKLILSLLFKKMGRDESNTLFRVTTQFLDILQLKDIFNLLKYIITAKPSDTFKADGLSLIGDKVQETTGVKKVGMPHKIFMLFTIFTLLFNKGYSMTSKLIILPFKAGLIGLILYLTGIDVRNIFAGLGPVFDYLKFNINIPEWTFMQYFKLHNSWLSWIKTTGGVSSIEELSMDTLSNSSLSHEEISNTINSSNTNINQESSNAEQGFIEKYNTKQFWGWVIAGVIVGGLAYWYIGNLVDGYLDRLINYRGPAGGFDVIPPVEPINNAPTSYLGNIWGKTKDLTLSTIESIKEYFLGPRGPRDPGDWGRGIDTNTQDVLSRKAEAAATARSKNLDFTDVLREKDINSTWHERWYNHYWPKTEDLPRRLEEIEAFKRSEAGLSLEDKFGFKSNTDLQGNTWLPGNKDPNPSTYSEASTSNISSNTSKTKFSPEPDYIPEKDPWMSKSQISEDTGYSSDSSEGSNWSGSTVKGKGN